MKSRDDITGRIVTIKETFQRGQSISENEKDLFSLAKKLDETDPEFRSVAYEGASMSIAISGFDVGAGLASWLEFKNGIASKHASQVHAGLGWALSQKRISPAEILSSVAPLMRFRVFDGSGYYDGIFRQRAAMTSKIVPDEFTDAFQFGYDQGIGRAIYYSCKGVAANIQELISSFPATRHSDLWRGTGIACVYVGGADEEMLRELYSQAASNCRHLSVGAALVARARADADAITQDAELACKLWCNCSAAEAYEMTLKVEPISGGTGHGREWISALAEEYATASSRR